MFTKTDATQIEINPFAETNNGEVVAVDAKINFDDNAEFRQKEIFSQRDFSEEDPREVQASKVGLNYIGLDGNIGCMGKIIYSRLQEAWIVFLTEIILKSKRGRACYGHDGYNQTE